MNLMSASLSTMKNVLKIRYLATQHVFNVFLVLDREFIHGPRGATDHSILIYKAS